MNDVKWDMYQYILESKDAVEHIVKNEDAIFKDALNYCRNDIDTIYIVGSGTSYHAAVSARSMLEKELKIKVNAMYPLRFKDDELVTSKKALVIGISHAGRSSSTIQALDKARQLGLKTIALTAERNRPISDHADITVYIEIGDEFAGPKTKGFIGSIATLDLLGLNIGVKQGLVSISRKQELIERMLKTTNNIPDIAAKAWQWYKDNKEDLIKSRK